MATIELVPVRISNASSGRTWYARALSHSVSGRGDDPKSALEDLRSKLDSALGGAPIELLVRSVNVTFPSSLTETDFYEWMREKGKDASVAASLRRP